MYLPASFYWLSTDIRLIYLFFILAFLWQIPKLIMHFIVMIVRSELIYRCRALSHSHVHVIQLHCPAACTASVRSITLSMICSHISFKFRAFQLAAIVASSPNDPILPKFICNQYEYHISEFSLALLVAAIVLIIYFTALPPSHNECNLEITAVGTRSS
jgi:hypothetical protein